MKGIKKFFKVLSGAGNAFIQDNCIKLSAALSYYTIFSIGPMLIIIISLSALFYGQEAVQGKLFSQISGLIGDSAALQIQEIIKNTHRENNGNIGTLIGGIILFVGATGIFTEMQDSINFIWSIRVKPKRGVIKFLVNRLISFSLIISLGFLLLVSLVVNALFDLLNDRLTHYFPETAVYVFYVMNIVLILLIITVLFAIIFKLLPDGKIQWKDSLIGAFFTALLFLLGKAGIGYYLGNSNLGVTYGTAASVIIILAWVYYTSIILYFGAEFTKVYALEYGGGIIPNDNAVFIIKRESKEIEIIPEALAGKHHK